MTRDHDCGQLERIFHGCDQTGDGRVSLQVRRKCLSEFEILSRFMLSGVQRAGPEQWGPDHGRDV